MKAPRHIVRAAGSSAALAAIVLLSACGGGSGDSVASGAATTAGSDAAKPVKPSTHSSTGSSGTAAPVNSAPAIHVTHVSPHGRDVSLLTMNPDKVRFRFIPGTADPGGYNSTKDAPNTYRHSMLAAFNGAFLPQHTEGGYYFRGNMFSDLRDNRASLVIDKNGTLDVINWNGNDPSKYQVVRQNIRMMINDGVDKTIGHNGCDDWGPLGTGPSAHRRCPGERSAVGVTADGTVIYAFGFEVMAGDLATALKKAGVVRAMALDINNWWPSAYTYIDGKGKRIDSSVRDDPTRYSSSTPWKKDFVVVLPR